MKKTTKASSPRKTNARSQGKRRSKVDDRFSELARNKNISDATRRRRQAERLGQVLRVFELIQGRAKWSRRALTAELDCSEKTLDRHLNVLKTFGLHVRYDPVHECYQMISSVRFPTLNVTEDEAIGLVMATAITQAAGFDIGAGAKPVSRKLATKSDTEIAQILDDGEKLFMVMGLQLANHRKHREIIRTAQLALLERRQLVGQYKSPYKSEPQKVELSPWRICFIKQAWYLIAKPSDADEPRTYRLARFTSLKPSKALALQRPDFDLETYFGNAWAVYRGDKRYDVEILFSPDAADLVTETEWHRSQDDKKHKDGSVTLYFTVDGLNEIVHWVLGWSNRAKVIEPSELRELVKGRLKQALNQYER